MNANIKRWLEDAVAEFGEPLESVVVGRHDNRSHTDPTVVPDEGVVLAPDEALRKLDLDFDDGFGGADCFPIYAWTASRVFFITEYDGSTGLSWVPRNPVDIMPGFSGQ